MDTNTVNHAPLRRSRQDRMLGGVAAGIAEHVGIDVVLVRIAFAVLTVVGGGGIMLYLAGLLLIPDEGTDQSIAGSIFGPLQSREPERTATMSPQSNQSRPFGLPPLFRAGSSDQHMRVSDAERQAVADRLAEHYSDGRLDQAEFDDRVSQAMNAKTRGDLNGLFDDLPDTGAPAVPPSGTQGVPARRPDRHAHPILFVGLAVVVALAAAHVLFWATVPWLWVGLLAVIVLVAAGRIGHGHHPDHHPGQDR